MRALTVEPGVRDSARLEDVDDPPREDGPVVVETLAIGVCGTDGDVIAGSHGTPPPGRRRMILGHESLGRVRDAPAGSGLDPGDLVVGIVRRPDPQPCLNCGVGEWDMCRNGRYTERGIKERDGYCSDVYRIHPEYAVKVDRALGMLGVLLEPTSVVAKAWEHVERIGQRALFRPRTALVTGAGPIGQLAALLGVQRGLDVHVLDRMTSGTKPELVRALGATYHAGSRIAETRVLPDVVIECTGADEIIVDVMRHNAPGAVVCLTGVSAGGRTISVDAGTLNTTMVLENDVVFGSVNANRRHYDAAASALAAADHGWLERMITARLPLDRWRDALARGSDDVKRVIELAR
jgi:threonine dehydrogenase-like Zn-dependent dehydrogenase